MAGPPGADQGGASRDSLVGLGRWLSRGVASAVCVPGQCNRKQRVMRRGNSNTSNAKRSRGHARSNGRKPPNPNRSIESNAPDGGKVRGNASQLYERYVGLAREAQSAGDRIGAEGFLQYAEHYFRVLNATAPRRDTPTESGVSVSQESAPGGNGQGGNGGPAGAAEKPLRSGGRPNEEPLDEGAKEPETAVN